MNFKTGIYLFIALLFLSLIGCNNKSDSYSANKNPPQNVSESFYKKSVEVLNFYIEKLESRSSYTEEDNEYLLEYYRSMPSSSIEEVMIKTSLTYLDLIYKNFEVNLKANKEEGMKLNINEFEDQKINTLKLLEINNQ